MEILLPHLNLLQHRGPRTKPGIIPTDEDGAALEQANPDNL